jgi:IS30 family transposase
MRLYNTCLKAGLKPNTLLEYTHEKNTSNHNHHLTKEDRLELAHFKDKGYSLRMIADMMDSSVSTISEEIARHKKKNGQYDPLYAHQQA